MYVVNIGQLSFYGEHILSQEPDWSGQKGRVNHEILENLLPKTENIKKLACICGPIPFTRDCVRLLEQNFLYLKNEVWKFEG